MNYTDLRKLSLEFRRISSNLLNSNMDDADINLSRFLKYVNGNEFISNALNQKIKDITFDFKEGFIIESSDWARFKIPEDEGCHIKAQYEYMTFIDDSKETNVLNETMQFYWSDKNINRKIQNFFEKAVKTLIDFINDQISMEMIITEDFNKFKQGDTFIQHIDTLHGAANQQASGLIQNYNLSNDMQPILSLIEKIIISLTDIKDVDDSEVEDVKDDLEIVQEQLKSSSPKKSRIKKALNGIKNFVEKFSLELGVSLATNVVTETDWNNLIQQIEMVLSNIE